MSTYVQHIMYTTDIQKEILEERDLREQSDEAHVQDNTKCLAEGAEGNVRLKVDLCVEVE